MPDPIPGFSSGLRRIFFGARAMHTPSRVVLSLMVGLRLQACRREFFATFHVRPNERVVQYHHARSNSAPKNSIQGRAIPQSLGTNSWGTFARIQHRVNAPLHKG